MRARRKPQRHPPPPRLDPARSDEDFKNQLTRLHERVCAHLAALQEGRESAVDDLALVCRILAAHGDGDDVLKRAIRRFGLIQPEVLVSTPAERRAVIDLAFGGIWSTGLPAAPGSVVFEELMPILDWAGSLALASPVLKRRFNTWAQVITDFANANGAHLSGSMPEILGHIVFPSIGDRDLGSYMIGSAGVVVEQALRSILEQLALPTSEVPEAPPPTVSRLVVHSAIGSIAAGVEAQFGFVTEGEFIRLPEGTHGLGPWDFSMSAARDPDADTWAVTVHKG